MTDHAAFSARSLTELPIAIALLDDDDRVAKSSAKVSETFGRGMRLLGVSVAEWFLPEDREAIYSALAGLRSGATETVVEAKAEVESGQVRVFELSFSCTPANERVVLFRDVTAERAASNEIRSGLMTDPITGLGSTLLFDERLAHAIVRSQRGAKRPAAVLLKVAIDAEVYPGGLDGEVLRIIAFRLENYLRASDTIAFLREETFALLLEDVAGEPEAVEVARRVIEVCTMPITLERGQILLEVHAGVMYASPSMTARDVMQSARLALSSAVADGQVWGFSSLTRTEGLDDQSAQS